MKPVLYLLMGLPGAGKTTAAKALEAVTGATRLTSDEERFALWKKPTFSEEEHAVLYQHLNLRTKKLLAAGKNVIYDANINRKIHRDEKYEIAKELGADVILLWVVTHRIVALDRRVTETKHHHLVPKHEDPKSMFERVADTIEEPDNFEPHIKLDGTIITSEYIKKRLNIL